MFKLDEIGMYEQCFTHIHEGTATMIAVERMSKSDEFKALEIVLTPVEQEFAKWVMDNRGIEQRRLDRITVNDLLMYPLVYCEFPKPKGIPGEGDIAHMLVDGNHRYVKASMVGMFQIKARVAPETLWRKFQVIDIPMEIAKFFVEHDSGMP